MAIIDELISILGYKIEGKEALKEYTQGMEDTQRKAEALGRTIGLLAAAATTAAIGAFSFLGKSVIETSAKFEDYQATLTTITGSSQKAREALDWVTKFGATTPYEVGEVTDAFVKLKAYGLDPMDGTLTAVGDASSGMGKKLNQGVEAIADAVTGENERLKEYGITAKIKGDQVTYSWIQNGKKLSATMSKTGTEVSSFLKKNFEDRFGGAMERQSHTWNGLMSNLGDAWVGFQRKIGDAGFFTVMKSNLESVMNYIGRLADDGTLDRWAKSLSSVLEGVAWVVGIAIDRIGRHIGKLSELGGKLMDALGPFKWLGLAIAAWLFPGILAFGAIALAVDDFLTYLEGGDSVIGNFVKALSDFTGIDKDKVGEILAVLAGAAGLTAAAAGLSGFTLALNPLTAGLAAFGAAFIGAKAAFDYLAALQAEADKKPVSENPRNKPGFIEPTVDDSNQYRVWKNTQGDDQHKPLTYSNDALDWKSMMENAEGNAQKLNGSSAAGAVINDSSNKSVTNNITVPTIVNVQEATQAAGAAGAAVGQAIGQAAVPPVTRVEQESAF